MPKNRERGDDWTKAQEKMLRQLYPTMMARDVAASLPPPYRNVRAVYEKAAAMKLKKYGKKGTVKA